MDRLWPTIIVLGYDIWDTLMSVTAAATVMGVFQVLCASLPVRRAMLKLVTTHAMAIMGVNRLERKVWRSLERTLAMDG